MCCILGFTSVKFLKSSYFGKNSNHKVNSIKRGIVKAKQISNKYYDLTTSIHDISVVLDPRFKLAYYKSKNFSNQFIKELKRK